MRIATPLHSEPEPRLAWVEVASSLQLPQFLIIGLPGPEVSEARERVRAAVAASGFEFPRRRVVLNLSPASVRKQGTGMDLAMALAVLGSSDDSSSREKEIWIASGELGLDGSVKPAGRVARALHAAWSARADGLLVAREEAAAAARWTELIREGGGFLTPPPQIHAVDSLRDAWETVVDPRARSPGVFGTAEIARAPAPAAGPALLPLSPMLERIIGVAASGAHHLLVLGPRGTGKSHALEWLIAAQPEPTASVVLTRALLAELAEPAGTEPARTVPVRRISPQVKPAALIGSATPVCVRPGEFSLAHGGLLVADELPEWARDSREVLREPMERGRILLTRRDGRTDFPAAFVLAANGNLCPCGGWPPETRPLNGGPALTPCRCSLPARGGYLGRLSGPVLDRIDIVLRLGVPAAAGADEEETSPLALRARVIQTRTTLDREYGGPPGKMDATRIEALLKTHRDWARDPALLTSRSLRSRHKILRVALTLAAWDGGPLTSAHLAEASLHRAERLLS